ncbi:MAG: DUF192 domain-containing protein [Elusimicrobiota bacterium]|jgi:uncharacterized membrane protein (UPF0127 family)|nr:DUF192 domain-containing protein [Elusimicrobiota bacterium]
MKKLSIKIVFIISITLMFSNTSFAFDYEDGQNVKVNLCAKDLTLVTAKTPKAHESGLSGFKKIPQDGMIFFFDDIKPRVFWMKDMNFPLDMVWITGDEIIGITENIPTQKVDDDSELKLYPSPQKVDIVIELNAGRAKKLKLKTGGKLKLLVQ